VDQEFVPNAEGHDLEERKYVEGVFLFPLLFLALVEHQLLGGYHGVRGAENETQPLISSFLTRLPTSSAVWPPSFHVWYA